MTPGEEAIYDHIAKENAKYARINVQVKVTERYISSCAYYEFDLLKKIEPKIWAFIKKEIGRVPIVERYNRSSLYHGVFNDVVMSIEHGLSSQGNWTVDPLNGEGVTITYGSFTDDLGVSKDVAKNCIERLVAKGKITRKRGMGGFQYLCDVREIAKEMIQNPGQYKALIFCPNEMTYVEDKSLYDIFKGRRKDIKPVQEYYEEEIQDIYNKIINQTTEEFEES